jgi:hypothetical protein
MNPAPREKKLPPERRLYEVWKAMRKRCYSKTNAKWHAYGARGIQVCERWQSYKIFREDVGLPPFEGATIDRVNPDGHYSPENCRWADQTTQLQNKRTNVFVRWKGETLALSEVCRREDVSQTWIYKQRKRRKIPAGSPKLAALVREAKARAGRYRGYHPAPHIPPEPLACNAARGCQIPEQIS